MSIDFQDAKYKDNIDNWQMIDDVCEGDDVDKYLLKLNPLDKSDANNNRNKQYAERAIFYNISGRTLQGMVGLVFGKPPQLELPNQLEYLELSVDGKGTTLIEQSQDVVSDIIKYARGGLFVTYPQTTGDLSQADIASGKYFATIHEYDASQIINVDYINDGAMVKLSLVVLKESVTVRDGYERKEVDQIRELALEDDVFIQRIWQKVEDDKGNETWAVIENGETTPTKSNGQTWDEIPFFLFDKGESLIKGLVEQNVGHYRNSADYEENLWFAGQSQWSISGLRQQELDELSESGFYIGGNRVIAVPNGEHLKCTTAPHNTPLSQAMKDKIDVMVGLGASFVTPSNSSRTATEASLDAGITSNALSLIVHNVNMAYQQCFVWVKDYMGDVGDVSYKINTDFIKSNVTPQELQAMVTSWLQGAIPTTSYLQYLKSIDKVDKDMTLDEFNAEVQSVDMPALDNMNNA